MLSIQLDPETNERLASVATKCGQSANDFVRNVITDALNEWEDVEVAIARIKNPAKRYTMAEVEQMLGLDD
jgi:predicted DNA-binding protein